MCGYANWQQLLTQFLPWCWWDQTQQNWDFNFITCTPIYPVTSVRFYFKFNQFILCGIIWKILGRKKLTQKMFWNTDQRTKQAFQFRDSAALVQILRIRIGFFWKCQKYPFFYHKSLRKSYWTKILVILIFGNRYIVFINTNYQPQ